MTGTQLNPMYVAELVNKLIAEYHAAGECSSLPLKQYLQKCGIIPHGINTFVEYQGIIDHDLICLIHCSEGHWAAWNCYRSGLVEAF
jgi:hypothetical protein